MNTVLTQAELEKSVFESFSQVAPFIVTQGTIENRNPPEPDIVCTIENRGQVGFELTELIDQSHMERIALMFHTRNYLNNYWKDNLNKDKSSIFYNKYKDALLHFDFSQNSRLNERKAVIEIVFSMLLDLDDDAEGIHFESNPELLPIFEYVNINHIGINGPNIDVGSSGWLGDPTASAIKKKCSKKYTGDYPIELLAHIETNLLPPDDVWLPSIEGHATQIDESPFDKLWVFDRTSNSIIYTYGA